MNPYSGRSMGEALGRAMAWLLLAPLRVLSALARRFR